MEWTTDAEKAIVLCRRWVGGQSASLAACDFYLFGSAIYEGGAQFDPMHSDLDIVCILPQKADQGALERYDLVKDIGESKRTLELDMIRELSRNVCDEPGVSVVPVTAFELQFNVHKSGVRKFFTRNTFLNLRTSELLPKLDHADEIIVDDEVRHGLEYVQGVRNKYLSVAANGRGGIADHHGSDPLPKALTRIAAQIDPDVKPGRWYDTRGGLEFMHQLLLKRQAEDEEFRALFDRLSVRRGGRGLTNQPFTNLHQLLMAEVLYDECFRTYTVKKAEVFTQPSRPNVTDVEHDLELRRDKFAVTPYRHDAEPPLFSRAKALRDNIANWRPNLDNDHPFLWTSNLISELGNAIEARGLGNHGYGIMAERVVPETALAMRFDIAVKLFAGEADPEEWLPVEITRFRTVSKLVVDLSALSDAKISVAYVVWGVPRDKLHKINQHVTSIESNSPNLKVVLFPAASDQPHGK